MANELTRVSLYDLHVWSGRLIDAGVDPDAVIVFDSDGRDIDTVPLEANEDGSPRSKVGFVALGGGECLFSTERLGIEGAVSALCVTLTV